MGREKIRLRGINDFPFSLFRNPPDPVPVTWLQGPRDGGYGGNSHFAPPDRRFYISLEGRAGFDSLCDAALDLMERELGGHPDRHDPLGFKWIVTPDERSATIIGGSVYVAGKAWSGDNEGVSVQFDISNFTGMAFGRIGRTLILPIRTSQPFNWTALDDVGFERLMFRLFFELENEFDDVEWLQKTRAADSGRDISATRVENNNRVLIQARHQQDSITAPEVNNVVVKAETWNPAFQEVIVVTTSAFTQEAVRWADNHNANPGTRPIVKLEPHGHLEVMLTRHPHLIAHLGLR